MPNLTRFLTADDASELQRLRLEALAHYSEAFLTSYQRESSYDTDHFALEIETARHQPHLGYLGVFALNPDENAQVNPNESDQESLLGYVKLASNFLEKQMHLAQIYQLYISAEQRNQGLAGQLLIEAFDLLRQQRVEIVTLTCISDNQPALNLYQKYGFKICGRRPNAVKWQQRYQDELELIKVL